MCITMSVSWQLHLLLLLLVAVGAQRAGAVVSSEDESAHLQALQTLPVAQALQKGTAGSPHPMRAWDKKQLLYCRVGIGYHLQILPDGSVGGVHEPNEYCWLKVSAMRRGVVRIRGIKSGLYLCMNAEGLAYGMKKFSKDCLLKENLEENHYNTYSSFSNPHIYLALSRKGQLKNGKGISHHRRSTHFLPRRTQ